ncbi:MAG TPA: hypothetical protein VN131_06510 [Mobilitalea sp.]|nr:hypothetical protein [Mobilitalea sp.]
MNEELVRRVVKYKLNAANNLIDKLPEDLQKDINSIRRVITECLNEIPSEPKEQSTEKKQSANQLNKINIE